MKKVRTKDAQIKLSEKVGDENALRLPLILNSPGIFTSNLARKFPASSSQLTFQSLRCVITIS